LPFPQKDFDSLCAFANLSLPFALKILLVSKMTHAGKDHRHTMLVSSGNDFFVGRLSDFPNQGMLTSTTTNDEYFHLRTPTITTGKAISTRRLGDTKKQDKGLTKKIF
jgi:hypothetical protein